VLFQQAAAQEGPLAGEVAARRERLAQMAGRMLAEIHADRGQRLSAEQLDALGHALIGAAESLANWWLTRPAAPRDAVLEALLALTGLELPRPSADGGPE
jgi:hypothetical protein